MRVSMEIEVTRGAVSAVLSFGTRVTLSAWIDMAGAAKVGGLVGVCARVGATVAGVELLGAARLRERLGEVPGRMVRVYRESMRRPDLLDRVALDLLRDYGDSPIGLGQRLARDAASHLAPWARIETSGEVVVVWVPRWLPRASLVELERRLGAHSHRLLVMAAR